MPSLILPLLLLGTTELVSVDSLGVQANGPSDEHSAISSDGRFVAFESGANNLDPASAGAGGIYVRDRLLGRTRWIVDAVEPSISADGRLVTYNTSQVYVYDRQSGTTTLVSVGLGGAPANSGAGKARLSPDGRFVAFVSASSNLVPGDTNGTYDVFLRDLQLGTTERVSVSAQGVEGNDISMGCTVSILGARVAFWSRATTLVPGDVNGVADVFAWERATHKLFRITNGNAASESPSISANGRFVAFESLASNLTHDDPNPEADVFVYDVQADATTNETRLVPLGGVLPSISFDGHYLAFTNFPGVLRLDRTLGTFERVSVGIGGQPRNNPASFASIASDGSAVAFWSSASNLVPNDSNFQPDIFVREQ